ncbi:hypothetical protein HJFPF1_03491 [Paramyrothecium foliicola]|nr:hypothetical protein HJFPF1_03491 [Paramyrothecium foliicola]
MVAYLDRFGLSYRTKRSAIFVVRLGVIGQEDLTLSYSSSSVEWSDGLAWALVVCCWKWTDRSH